VVEEKVYSEMATGDCEVAPSLNACVKPQPVTQPKVMEVPQVDETEQELAGVATTVQAESE